MGLKFDSFRENEDEDGISISVGSNFSFSKKPLLSLVSSEVGVPRIFSRPKKIFHLGVCTLESLGCLMNLKVRECRNLNK